MIFLGLGSNLGDRQNYLERAMELLELRGVRILKKSSIYETLPVDMAPDVSLFLNMVVQVETSLPPAELLKACQLIENEIGRVRPLHTDDATSANIRLPESRVIDIDLLFYDDQIIQSDFLTLPHPKAHERFFVLEPMNDIASKFIHPVLQKSISELHRIFTSNR